MSIQAAWNSMLRSATIAAGIKTAKKISEKQPAVPEQKGPSDADVYKALAQQREGMLQKEILKKREREMAEQSAIEAAQAADEQPLNTLRGAMERIRQISEAAPRNLPTDEREERIRSALAEAFGTRREPNNG